MSRYRLYRAQPRARTRGVALLGLTAALGTAVLTAAPSALAATPSGPVLVTSPDGSAAAAAAVTAAGGTVLERLPMIGGVSATLPPGTVPADATIAPDAPLKLATDPAPPSAGTGTDGLSVDARTDGTPATADTPPAAPTTDPTRYATRPAVNAPAGGPDGTGVTVAVLDTGIADVGDLAGRVTHMTVDGNRTGDGFGHGTFMAGLVAGSGAASSGLYAGLAPGARLLDVRVADSQGNTSLIRVLEGLQAIIDVAPADGVRVVNLSLASGSPLPYQIDPLSQALEAVWHAGIAVVVPTGNDGAGVVTSPGLDPALLSVGAANTHGSTDPAAFTAAAFSGSSPSGVSPARPDLLAPGTHTVSLMVPGSVVAQANPLSAVPGGYFRGSGTSMATAVVSGAVADLLSAYPGLSPDEVKSALVSSAAPTADPTAPGTLDLTAALAAAAGLPNASGPAPALNPPDDLGAVGLPSEGISRADTRALKALADAWRDDNPAAAARAWASLSPTARAWADRTWAGLDPQARAWAANAWAAQAGEFAAAGGSDADHWLARAWAARAWAARAWAARAWAARAWAGDDWSARAWAARAWAARAWAGDDWSARAWAARAWAARAWASHDWS